MAKKNNSELVQEALDYAKEQKETESHFEPLLVYTFSATRLSGSRKREHRYNVVSQFVEYPPSLTDQTHALTLAEQVRRGQGDAEKLDKNAFDFPDGKDDGSEAHGIFELSERVDRWIAEQNLGDELRQSFRQQILNRKVISDVAKATESNASSATEQPAATDSTETQK